MPINYYQGFFSVTGHLNEYYSYHSAASYRRKHAASITYECTGTALGKKEKKKKQNLKQS